MKITAASHLADSTLRDEVGRLAGAEREATVAFIVHLAEFDARRLWVGAGFSSMFAYCLEVLRLSEDAAFNRIEVARMAREHPVILDMLAAGTLTPTTARRLRRHLTAANESDLLRAAAGKSKQEVDLLVATLCPQPDVPTRIRPLPAPSVPTVPPASSSVAGEAAVPMATSAVHSPVLTAAESTVPPAPLNPSPRAMPAPTAVLRPLSTDRYEFRFTARAETRELLRRAQDLLAGSVRSGDVGEVVHRALAKLVSELERKKAGLSQRPRKVSASAPGGVDSRYIPVAVRRAVWLRDGGRCAFVGPHGHRCGSRRHLEYHHVVPYAAGGKATVENIQLRCRPHNQYESVTYYGPGRAYGGIDVASRGGESPVIDARTRSGTGGSPAVAAGGSAFT